MRRTDHAAAIIQCASGTITGMLVTQPPLWTHNGATGTFPLGCASLIIGMGSMRSPEQTVGYAHRLPAVSASTAAAPPVAPANQSGTPLALRDTDFPPWTRKSGRGHPGDRRKNPRRSQNGSDAPPLVMISVLFGLVFGFQPFLPSFLPSLLTCLLACLLTY